MENSSPIRLFHYTYAHKLPLIWKSAGLIASPPGARILEKGVEVGRNGSDEKRVLWFSTNKSFEQTAVKKTMKNGRLTRGPLLEHARTIGVVRFELIQTDELELFAWPDLAKFACISFSERKKMEKAGLSVGANPSEWYGVILENGSMGLHQFTLQKLDVSSGSPVWKNSTIEVELEAFEKIGIKVQSL